MSSESSAMVCNQCEQTAHGTGCFINASPGVCGKDKDVESLQEILDSMREVVEGVRTSPAAARLAEEHDVVMPITFAMSRLLNGETDAQTAVRQLMTRELKVESEL